MAWTKEQLLGLIPRIQTGDKQGEPQTESLREIERILNSYSFTPRELDIIEQRIKEASVERFNRP